jgi:hypothetical protein
MLANATTENSAKAPPRIVGKPLTSSFDIFYSGYNLQADEFTRSRNALRATQNLCA